MKLTAITDGIRWQAPEVLEGKSTMRTSVDVYAYAVFCTEVLNFGEIPWPHWSDDEVRECVLSESHSTEWVIDANIVTGTLIEEERRPEYPVAEAARLGILQVMNECWEPSPDARPRFKEVVRALKQTYSSDDR